MALMVSPLLQALHPDLLLVIVYLGCWSTRQAVCATDVLQWANDGALPFLSLRSLSSPVLEKANASSLRFPPSLLQLTGKQCHMTLLFRTAQTLVLQVLVRCRGAH